MHEIDYKIHGDDMQFVEVELDPQEAVVAEAGGMMYMDDHIAMETIFGDGSQQNSGFMGALLGAGKRLLTGESLFMTVFQNQGVGKRKVAFGAPYPGKIIPVNLAGLGGELIVQKDSFLCAAKGVSIGIAFQKRLGAGLFGGEGLFFATLRGPGKIWPSPFPSRVWPAALSPPLRRPAVAGARKAPSSAESAVCSTATIAKAVYPAIWPSVTPPLSPEPGTYNFTA